MDIEGVGEAGDPERVRPVDVPAQIEGPGQLHRHETVGPGRDGSRGLELVLAAGQPEAGEQLAPALR